MISRFPGSRCLEVSGCSLRRKAGGRVAHDETRDIDRRRAATGLACARPRPAQLLGPALRNRVARRAGRARAAWRWAWERDMIMRVSAQGQAYGYLCAREQLDDPLLPKSAR